MKYLLTATDLCSGCLTCEQHLPGFISCCGGAQLISPWWIEQTEVVLAIDRAIRDCPMAAISMEAI